MNREGNSRHNAYLSSLPVFLLPTPLWHPFFSSFLPRWQKPSDSSDSFHTGRWLDREFLQPRLKTKSNPKSSIFPVLRYIFFPSNFTHNRRLVCLPVFFFSFLFVNHTNQASPFSHLVSLFLKRSLSLAKTSLWIQAHLKTKGGRWFTSVSLFLFKQL